MYIDIHEYGKKDIPPKNLQPEVQWQGVKNMIKNGVGKSNIKVYIKILNRIKILMELSIKEK